MRTTSLLLTLTLIVTASSTAPAVNPVDNNPEGLTKITNIENAYPDWSPDNSKLVFQSNRTGKFQIYLMNADGKNVVRLTNNDGDDAGPHFSPDGSKIVFSSERAGSTEVYVINSDGSNERRLTNFRADTSHPSWAPDGTRILFCSNKETPDRTLDWWDQYHDIYSMGADGSDIKRLTNLRTVATFPVWSPDGKKIAFRKVIRQPGFYDDTNLTQAETDSEVFIMNADGSGEVNLSKSAAYDGWPAWSPDGRKIAFGSNRRGVTQVYIASVDGSQLVRLINDRETDEDTRPAWSHDGKKLAFTRKRNGTMDIYTINAPRGGDHS